MKSIAKIIAMVAIALSVAVSAEAAKNERVEMVTREYISEIDCHSCEQKVMNTLPFQKGVKSVKVDLKTKTITVTYDPTKSSDEAVVAQLKKVGINSSPKRVSKSACSSGCADCSAKK